MLQIMSKTIIVLFFPFFFFLKKNILFNTFLFLYLIKTVLADSYIRGIIFLEPYLFLYVWNHFFFFFF